LAARNETLGRRAEGIPQGLKPTSSAGINAKAEALAYLEANAKRLSKVLSAQDGELWCGTRCEGYGELLDKEAQGDESRS
jgi:hypothetical protein